MAEALEDIHGSVAVVFGGSSRPVDLGALFNAGRVPLLNPKIHTIQGRLAGRGI